MRDPIGIAGSVPAVIQSGTNGEIEKVVLPRAGENYSQDIGELFPMSAQEKIFSLNFNGLAAEKHINK